MATMDPIHFIPKSRQAAILSGRITHIIAAPHHQEAGTNHWCFYLATSPTTSIQLDCQPSHSIPSTVLPGGSKAYLIVSRELASKAYYNVKTVVWTPFWPSGTADTYPRGARPQCRS
jgi:hypothetical protein